ncbi:MAG TPA: SDR family NAD(P)-dependent oxidoreductase [Trebonia sp.]|nr:SDR family NAD(P)-dependent oxidoreductase [Trebonia sp.]
MPDQPPAGTLRFDGRVAVITGAGRGLGRAYAELLAARGAKVVVNDTGAAISGAGRDAGPADEVASAVKAAGGDAIACADSVTTPEGGAAIIAAALTHYGRLDILIHNAGNNRYADLPEMSDDDYGSVLDVHLRGAFHVTRAAFPHMAQAGYGRIVLTSSIGGIYGNHRVANYGSAKAGVIGLANVVALEGAPRGIRCNVIIPAALTRLAEGLDTSFYPPMQPELVAPAVGWLAHEACTVTGEMLVALAGRVARAYIAETPGVYQPSWTIEDIAARMEEIRDPDGAWILPVVPSGHIDHITRSFAMASGQNGRADEG